MREKKRDLSDLKMVVGSYYLFFTKKTLGSRELSTFLFNYVQPGLHLADEKKIILSRKKKINLYLRQH